METKQRGKGSLVTAAIGGFGIAITLGVAVGHLSRRVALSAV